MRASLGFVLVACFACARRSTAISSDPAPSASVSSPAPRVPTGEIELAIVDAAGSYHATIDRKKVESCRTKPMIGWALVAVRIDDSGAPTKSKVEQSAGIPEETLACVATQLRVPEPEGGFADYLVYVAFR
ncbi:MAG: hypothetical protein IPJ34_22725 [Myxococcales bacterium]|nr:hypothetical protein [Myxococcales bacterium]